MTDTVFFTSVNQSLSTECRRLCDFTDELDRSPKEKKERIAEYKCAKYRYEYDQMWIFTPNKYK